MYCNFSVSVKKMIKIAISLSIYNYTYLNHEKMLSLRRIVK